MQPGAKSPCFAGEPRIDAIWRTHPGDPDAGSRSELPTAPPGLGSLSFGDAIHGWSMPVQLEGAPAGLFATEDGGRTWRVIGSPCPRSWTLTGASRVSETNGWIACSGEAATIME